MKRSFLSLTLITACLTYLGLSRWMPISIPEAAPVVSAERAAPIASSGIQALELQTIQVNRPKFLIRRLKPHAEQDQAPIHIQDLGVPLNIPLSTSVNSSAVASLLQLDFSLPPAIIILPKRELTRVSPLLLDKKKNPS